MCVAGAGDVAGDGDPSSEIFHDLDDNEERKGDAMQECELDGAADDGVRCCWESGAADEEDASERIGRVVGCSAILHETEESDVEEMGAMGGEMGEMGGDMGKMGEMGEHTDAVAGEVNELETNETAE